MNYPRSQIVATPSSGIESFETYSSAFENTLNQFDWNLLNRLNPETVEATCDYDALEKILYSFVDSEFGHVEKQFLPFPLSAKFYQMLQLGVDYMMKKQTKLQRQLQQKDTEIEYLRHKLEKSIEKLDSLPRMANTEVKIAHSCPVCNRAFKAMLYLDKHMNKCHSEQIDAWRALRDGKPYGVSHAFKELHQEIDQLRACVTRQNFEERREVKINNPNLGKMPPHKPKAEPTKKTCDPGKIVGSTAIKPKMAQRDFVGHIEPQSGNKLFNSDSD